MSCDAIRRLEEHDDILELAQESVAELVSEGVSCSYAPGGIVKDALQDLRDTIAERCLDLLEDCPDAVPQEAR